MNEARLRRRWWKAVQDREASFDGLFVFGVLSTGIYCRPSCPARRPLARNVQFFSSPKAAGQEGFRACRRCRPELAIPRRPHLELALQACAYLESHFEDRISLKDLARALRISPPHLQRTFTRALGISPRAYLEALRFEEFRRLAASGRALAPAIFGAGFGSFRRPYEQARARLGMTPGTYRKGGIGMKIAYDVMDGPMGKALLAATPAGLCAVELGSSSRELLERLRQRHPRATFERNRQLLGEARALLSRRFKGVVEDRTISLDVRATVFQARVWDALRSIPPGSTRTYGQLARGLGKPGAARAVARACSSNPVAVLIPCHRAVGAGGELTGYRWGLGRKKWILEREREGAGAGALRPGRP